MAKTPRLKFYGIELTIPEIKELILCEGHLCNPATCQGRVQRIGKHSWLPYGGSYIKKDSRATAKEHPKSVQLGLLKYDKKENIREILSGDFTEVVKSAIISSNQNYVSGCNTNGG